ncbi:MAG: hypothetical protein I8H66_03580 [Sphingobacteriia bacterium]|nr:hypothetical protein [Sphingobacteriia bacterium]
MNKSILVMLVVVLFAAAGCTKDTVTESYTFYRPVYQTKAEVRTHIMADLPAPVALPGKIVRKDQYIYLNELNKGVHIIDVSNPANPVNRYFIAIPGCVDIAVNGNYLYADCYTDLVTIDISNPATAQLKKVNEAVFPHRYYEGFVADTSSVIVKWVRVDTVVKYNLKENLTHQLTMKDVWWASPPMFWSAAYSSGAGGSYGTAGSMARFALQNNRLYTVSLSDLKVFNIQQASSPDFVTAQSLSLGDIETIFPYRQQLFIGSRSGMTIYNTANPDQPSKQGQFLHSRSCDPVIADEDYAYVTLWGGSICGGFSNQLDVINIADLSAPTLVKSYPLTSPKGLSKDGNLLFVCDGAEGLKIMDVTSPGAVSLIKTINGFEGKDVIAQNGLAIVTAKDGLYCIDYTNLQNARLVGKIQLIKD